MAKWVTFYYSILDGLKDIVVHPNREDAEKYFLKNYKKYFNLKTPLKNFKLPYKYGFGHRAYYVISKNKFEKQFFKLEKERKNYD